MGRWEPGGSDRLRAAALELFLEHGYEQTTAADIAAAVGLTERTFYRHFPDKKEVLFGGSDEFRSMMVDSVLAVPDGLVPIEVVARALATASEFFPEERREWSRKRWQVLSANPGLLERELLKMADVSAGLGARLRERGIPEPAATLAAESGMTVFRVAFDAWLQPGETRALVEIEREMFAALGAVAQG